MTIKDNANGGNVGDPKQRFLGQRLFGPRASIVANMALMTIAIAGLVAVSQGQKSGQAVVLLAMLLSMGQGASARMSQVPLDERQSIVLANATSTGALLSSAIVALWCVLIGISEKGLWYPVSSLEWQTLGFFLFGLVAQISNIATAMMTPSYAAELLDDD